MTRMKTSIPARKVVYSSLATAVTTILIYVIETFAIKQPLPLPVSGAVMTVITFAVGYMTSPNPGDQVVDTEKTVRAASPII